MGEALFYKRMHGLKQKIYRWKQYNVKTTYTYYWNRYNVVSTTTYKWNKYNAVSTTVYVWNKWNVQTYSVGVSYSTNRSLPFMADQKVYSGYKVTSDYTVVGTGYVGTIESLKSSAVGKYCITDVYPAKGEFMQSLERYYGLGHFSWLPERYGYACTRWSSNPDASGEYENTTTFSSKDKGTTLIGTVTSTSSSTYPNGDISGSYYYDGRTTSTEYNKGTTSYGQVTSNSSSTYPSNGKSGSYWYVSAGSDTSYSKGSTKYSDVSSTNSSAYPDNGKSGSYWYVYSRSTTSYSQGSYIGDKLSTNRNEYPDNGKSGSYWYVFDGEA